MAPVSAVLAVDSLAADRRLPRRPADDPHVRRDAAARDRRRALAHRAPLGALRRRLGSRLPRHDLGRHRRDHRRAALPRRHELERGSRSTSTGTGRSPSGRAGSGSGAGSSSACLAGALIVRRSGDSVRALHGRRRAGRCCSRRRSAAGATGGTRSSTASTRRCRGRSRSTARARANTVPPDVPLRVPLGHPRRRCSCSGSTGASRSGGPALFSLYVAWYTAFRTFEETLRIDPSNHFLGQRVNFWVSLVVLRRERRVLRLVAVPAQAVGAEGAEARSPARSGRCPKGPKMAVPRGRVR